MDLNRLVLAVMTVDRQPAYVHQTLASLFAADPRVHELSGVHLVIGTNRAEYLGNLRHHAALRFHPLTDAEWERIKDWIVHRRFSHNYVRCLGLPVPDGGGLCVCEDDVVFRDHFLDGLLSTVNEMEQEGGLRDYCLALFSEGDFETDPSFYRGRHYCSYGWSYHGTQGMYYPKHVAQEMRGYIQLRGVENYTKPGDLLISDLYGDRMYACPRALVDHVGAVSTGLGGCGRSPSFSRPLRPIPRELWGRHDAVPEGEPAQAIMPASSQVLVPRVFHQIWVGAAPVPDAARKYGESWLAHHPGWELKLWTDQDVPQDLVTAEIYRQIAEPVHRADLLRHELLFRFGGVYVDVDFECLRSIEPLIRGATYFYGHELPDRPNIALLGSVPGHEFARWCLQCLAETWPWAGTDIIEETGPLFFGRAIQKYLGHHTIAPHMDPRTGDLAGHWRHAEGKDPLLAFLPWVFYPYWCDSKWQPEKCPNAYAVHHWQKNW